jgi:hypothetical protein
MDELIERLEHAPYYTTTLNQIENKVSLIATTCQSIGLPEKEMQELSEMLSANIELLKHPARKEVLHYHHAAKAIWIATALFLVVCLEGTGLYRVINNLEASKANDTKYRYLKLQDNIALNKLLWLTDSVYRINGTMRDRVIAKEEQNQKNIEILRRAIEMEKEAKELKKKVSTMAK